MSRLRQDQKAHPKALQQLEKEKQALEKKLNGAARKEAALQRDNEGLQVGLSRLNGLGYGLYLLVIGLVCDVFSVL